MNQDTQPDIYQNNDYPDQSTKHGELEPELHPEAPTVSDKVAPEVSKDDIQSGAVVNDLPLVQPGEVPHLYQQYEPTKVAEPKELSMPLEAYGTNGPIVTEYKPKLPGNADETVIEPVNPANPLQPNQINQDNKFMNDENKNANNEDQQNEVQQNEVPADQSADQTEDADKSADTATEVNR
jgi:hypothetical protein